MKNDSTSSQKTKTFKQKDRETVHGKIGYRIRQLMQLDGKKQIEEYKKDANKQI